MDGTLRIRVITGSCSDPESWVLLIFLPWTHMYVHLN
jgi:hypothetical protein